MLVKDPGSSHEGFVLSGAAKPTSIVPFEDSTDAEIEALAERTLKAAGLLMKLVNSLGSKAENLLERLPDDWKIAIEDAAASAMETCYRTASAVGGAKLAPDVGKYGHRLAVMVTGAAGGSTGLPSTLVELPVTITLMFGSIQKIARSYGFDSEDDLVRMECLRVLGSGSPLKGDDGVDTSFLASKLFVTGTLVHSVISAAAPRLALVMGQKLATQTVPVIGAATGATINFAFLCYFEEMAHVRFGLLKLARLHGHEAVALSFKNAAQKKSRLAVRDV